MLTVVSYAAPEPSDSERSDDKSAAVVQLQRYLDTTDSLTARFRSVVLDANGVMIEDLEREGSIAIKKPNRFRWSYEAPSAFVVVADGVDWWSFDEDMEQAVVRKLADYRGANPTLLLGGDANITDEFTVTSSWQVEGVPWIELVPKDENSDFIKVRLTFKNDTIHLMELIDRLDKTSRIVFDDVKVNPPIDDEWFVFVPPDNVDVVGKPSTKPDVGSDTVAPRDPSNSESLSQP